MKWIALSLIVLGACSKAEQPKKVEHVEHMHNGEKEREADCRCKPHCKIEEKHCGCTTGCGCR